MDGCSLADAFPDAGESDRYIRGAGDESRRQERKRSRRCRNGEIQALRPEPDRPFAKRTEPVLAMNEATGLREHSPATAAYPYEPFVGECEQDMGNFAAIRKNVPSATELSSGLGSLPAYFGANPNDLTSITNMAKPQTKTTEGFTSQAAPFVDTIGGDSDESYRLSPDFGEVFANPHVQTQTSLQGPTPTEKQFAYLTPTSMGVSEQLPIPNTDMFWKPKTRTGGSTAFFNQLRAPGGQPSVPQNEPEEKEAPVRREMLEKMDRIFARLDDMEAAKGENANTEILMFIATGLGILFLMDMSCRLAMGLRK